MEAVELRREGVRKGGSSRARRPIKARKGWKEGIMDKGGGGEEEVRSEKGN